MMYEREPALILVDFPRDESELFIENAIRGPIKKISFMLSMQLLTCVYMWLDDETVTLYIYIEEQTLVLFV